MRENEVIEAACVVALAVAWACLAVLRMLLVPVVALAVVLLTPRRRAAREKATASAEAPEAPIPAPEAAVSLASLAAELQALPAAELRALAGTRRRLPKRELTAMVLAMPI